MTGMLFNDNEPENNNEEADDSILGFADVTDGDDDDAALFSAKTPACDAAADCDAGGVKAPPRPFTVKTKKSKVPYTFKRFISNAVSRTMFFKFEGSLAERSKLFDDVAYRREELKEQLVECAKQGVHVTGGTVEAVIPIDWVTIDPAWCRTKPVDWNHVAEITVNFDENSLDLPTVTMRKIFDPLGRLLGVVMSLTDGVHRTCSLYERGDTHIRAMVTIVNTVAEEAQIYSNRNYGRRTHSRHDVVKALITAKDPKVMELARIIGDYGFKLQDPEKTGSKCAPAEIDGVKGLIACFDRFGETVLRRVMKLLGDPRFPLWQFNVTALAPDFLTALCRYVTELERPGYIHTDITHHVFLTMTPETLARSAKNSTSADRIGKLLGYQPFKNGVISNSENTRSLQILGELIATARELYKPSKRPAWFHNKYKSALDVYYNTHMSPQEKATAVNAIRRQLAKIKRADGWYDGDSPMVR